uniref:Uncharacterized protein n=1 Tax=Daphnia galeata TaxID=27404 RepID=A0A8J2RH11_9CRUS|nr:unnamed protein product [Daphnia galeata]
MSKGIPPAMSSRLLGPFLSHSIGFPVATISRKVYSYIPIIGPMTVDDLPNQPGGISFLRQGEAELFLGALIATSGRLKIADLSSLWFSGSFSIIIPIPNSSTNIGALIEPMSTNVINAYMSSYKVWICIESIVALNKRIMVESSNSKENPSAGNFQTTDYVVTEITSDPFSCGCLVSTLIAFITSPKNKPIINSVYDIPNVTGLKIMVNRNLGADVMLQKLRYPDKGRRAGKPRLG